MAQKFQRPYLDKRYRPPRWFGKEPPRKSPSNPKCPKCDKDDRVELVHSNIVNSDGMFIPATYRCYRCDRDF